MSRSDAVKVGLVVIGRNEGERLRKCLESLIGLGVPIVYVDSGSVDGSATLARKMGVEVLELDARMAFTAARARNDGLQRAVLRRGLRAQPWLVAKAAAFLDAHESSGTSDGLAQPKCSSMRLWIGWLST